MPIYQPEREERCSRTCGSVNEALGGPLDGDAIARLFERIIDEARRIERLEAERDAREHGQHVRTPELTPRHQRERAGHGRRDERTRDARRRSRRSSRTSSSWAWTCTARPARRAPCSAWSARGKVDPRLIELLDGVHEVLRITEPYKLRQPHLQAGGHRRHDRRRPDRRRRGDRHGRPVLGGDRGAGARDRRGGEARRRQDPARRRVQAAQLALQLPGPRRGGAADAARRAPTRTT